MQFQCFVPIVPFPLHFRRPLPSKSSKSTKKRVKFELNVSFDSKSIARGFVVGFVAISSRTSSSFRSKHFITSSSLSSLSRMATIIISRHVSWRFFFASDCVNRDLRLIHEDYSYTSDIFFSNLKSFLESPPRII